VWERTRSPFAVSQKRECFKYPPETIGDFVPEVAKFGAWRPTAESQKPATGGISGVTKGKISSRRTGWLTWEDSNFHITFSKNAFEMSTEFPLSWPKFDLETFTAPS
jgi:hypothetical protein